MKSYPLKNKLIISWTPQLPIALKIYVENGLLLSDIYHEKNVQRREIDCGIPLLNPAIFGIDVVEHIFNMLGENPLLSTANYTKYNDAQIELFNSLKASKPLQELFIDCPNLAWLLVMFNYYSHSFHVIEYMLRFKRKLIIAKIFDVIPSEKAVKFLSKTTLLNGRQDELRWLSIFIGNDILIDTYKHKETVTLQELYLSNRFPVLSGSTLLKSVSKDKKEFLRDYKSGMVTLYKIVTESIRIGENIGIKNAKNFVLGCTDKESVIIIHHKWTQKLKETTRFLKEDILLEPPQITDCDEIMFISTINMLIQEGRDMDHCIASYKSKVMSGDSYIYSVRSPKGERLTLELAYSKGVYSALEMRGEHNSTPSDFAWNFVHTWLKAENDVLAQKRESSRQALDAE